MQAVYSTKPSDDDWERVHDLLRGKVAVVGECWEWTGYRMVNGHGQIRRSALSSSAILVHRYVWSELFGPIPDCVCHHCDNPPCVRPTHLWLGTHRDNMDDMLRKGRNTPMPKRWDGIHCAKGHRIMDNPYYDPRTGARRCKTCMNEKGRRYWKEHPERLNAGRTLRQAQTKGEK